jgi:hypothetical protein
MNARATLSKARKVRGNGGGTVCIQFLGSHIFCGPSVFSNIKCIVSHSPVSKQRICKQRAFLDNAHNIHARNSRRTEFSVVRAATVAMQQRGKQPYTTIKGLFSTRSVQGRFKEDILATQSFPCGGGVE